jgi:hypothetical protein
MRYSFIFSALWLSPLRQSFTWALPQISAIVLLTAPFAMLCNDYPLTLHNLLGQYIWLVIICLPPCFMHLILRGALLLRKSQPN